jgi:recombinational DNA repair protein (RecF pathway)
VAGQSYSVDAFVLGKKPPADAFEMLTVFSCDHGAQTAFQRLSRKTSGHLAHLDLFDEVSLVLESSAQGGTGRFVKEARLITRYSEIGRNYDALRFASLLATLVARNAVPDESRAAVYALLRQAFSAFAHTARPDIVYFKSLYLFARDEGYPVKQEWFPTLPAIDRETVATVLNAPVSTQTAASDDVTRLLLHLENYLRGHTEIFLD